MSTGCIAPTALSRSERLLDAFDDRIELSLALDRIDQCKAVDEAACAAEHDLFVEHIAIVLPRQHKPCRAVRRIVHGVASVGLLPDHVHIAANCVAITVLESADQKPTPPANAGKDLTITGLRPSLRSEKVRWVA